MAIIPKFFLNAVVALGVPKDNNSKQWIGTGFLMGRKEDSDITKSTIYIITNKHVVENQNTLLVRFNNINGNGVKDLPMSLQKEYGKNYTEHPLPETDIVAIQISPKVIRDNQLELFYFDKDDHALSLKQMEDTGVSEGSLIYSLGFPMNLVGEITKAPICRLGCISRIADAFIQENAQKFLVDAQVFPGNSGGPIISRPEIVSIEGTETNDNANLIGILSAYIPYRDIMVSQQTGRAMMIQEENSGLTIVHPVDRIREVIELEHNRVENILRQKTALNSEENANPEGM